MKKREIIKKNEDFKKIIDKRKVVRNKYFSVFYNGADIMLFGISVPKKTGNAVVRNKIKRRIKNIIDKYKKNLQNNKQYVIIVKGSVLDLSYSDMERELINLMKEIL